MQIFLALPYYSQHALFASLSAFSLLLLSMLNFVKYFNRTHLAVVYLFNQFAVLRSPQFSIGKPLGFTATDFFTVQMPFLMSSQQCRSVEVEELERTKCMNTKWDICPIRHRLYDGANTSKRIDSLLFLVVDSHFF